MASEDMTTSFRIDELLPIFSNLSNVISDIGDSKKQSDNDLLDSKLIIDEERVIYGRSTSYNNKNDILREPLNSTCEVLLDSATSSSRENESCCAEADDPMFLHDKICSSVSSKSFAIEQTLLPWNERLPSSEPEPKKSFKRKQPENDKMHSMQSFEEFAEFQTFADDVMCVHRRSHFTADSVSRTSQNRSRDFFSDSTLLWKAGQSSSVEAAQVFRHGNETWRACNLETSNCAKTQPKQTLLTLAEEWRTFSHSQAATEDQRFDAISTDNPFQECVTDEILTKYFHVVTPTNDSIIRNQSLFLSDTRKLPVEITADAGVTEENIERSEQPNQFNLKIKSYSDLLYSRLSEDHIFRNFPLLPVTYKNQFQLQDRLDLFPQDIRKRPDLIVPTNIFCLVTGRLGIPSHRKKHAVTVGEILRRVESPETLNISMLGPILRKAKSKNGSLYLRQKLQRIGIELPQGRRKTAHCTLFTLLTESEADKLAEDFSKLCKHKFPAQQAAKELTEKCSGNDDLINNLPQSLTDVLSLVDIYIELCSGFSCKQTNITSGIERKLYDFDALTHGFGLKTLISSIKTFRSFVETICSSMLR